MHKLSSTFAAACLLLASFVAVACENDRGATALGLAGPSATSAALVAAEPARIAAEFRSSPTCRENMPFDARVTVSVRARRDLFIRRFGFEFFDRFGRRVLPFVLPGAIGLASSFAGPVPLPMSSPIPFPGQGQLSSVQVQTGAQQRFLFRLQFDCGVPPRGTLLVSVETADLRDRVDVAKINVQIE